MNPRIHIEFATNAPTAAILRRGPTNWAQLLRWNTSHDTVQPGSWFHGRVYENGCSISPNGELFAYFAAKYHGEKTQDIKNAWTAVSKLPWLTALAIWPMSDTYGGYASFVNDKTLIIDCPHWDDLITKDRLPKEFTVIPRWIGSGAPTQSLPEIPLGSAFFDEGTGIDQAGCPFEYSEGKLMRDGGVIIDLASMEPQPEAPPDEAYSW